MQVTLEVFISGPRDGAPWPPKGTVIDLPDAEAEDMIRAGQATPYTAPPETAVAPAPETTTPPAPETPAPPAPETPAPAASTPPAEAPAKAKA